MTWQSMKYSSSNILFKGWVFSLSIWFASYVVTLLFRVPGLVVIPFRTALSNFIAASVWGLILAYVLTRFMEYADG